MDELPGELLHEIASADPAAYRGLVIAYPRFARMINVWKRMDYMILAGVDCRVLKTHWWISPRIEWKLNGRRHDVYGPAVCYEGGRDHWYYRGERHRLDGPAIVIPNVCEQWYIHGKRHRIGGPAFVGGPRSIWFVNGKRHRGDGPAYTYDGFIEKWYLNDVLHRTDGPAITYKNGTELWFLDGELHRIDGPAMILPGGIRQWWQGGQLHRIGGPAIENPGARRKKRWYLRGKRLTRAEYERILDSEKYRGQTCDLAHSQI